MNKSSYRHSAARRGASHGFTLIEVMITVAVVAILASIALPSYAEYTLRGRLVQAQMGLATLRVRMEQYYQDNRSYVGGPCARSERLGSFDIACSTLTAGGYTIAATGHGAAAGFVYLTDDSAQQKTTAVPASWGAVPAGGHACWVMKRSDKC